MIKSQDELNPCNDGHRSSDVLVATIEKCERLQKQLDIALNGLKDIQRRISQSYVDTIQKQLVRF